MMIYICLSLLCYLLVVYLYLQILKNWDYSNYDWFIISPLKENILDYFSNHHQAQYKFNYILYFYIHTYIFLLSYPLLAVWIFDFIIIVSFIIDYIIYNKL